MLHIRHLFLTSLFVFSFALAHGQENNAANTLLPDIDPQDIEIKGSYRPSFPGLRRQPILGFNPKPRVFQIDPLRVPFMETPEEVAADIPVSYLERPAQPPIEMIEYPLMGRYYLQTGVGNFLTPELRFEAESYLPNARQWLVNLDAIGTQGHTPTNTDFSRDRNTQMLQGQLDIRYRSLRNRGKFLETRVSQQFAQNYVWTDNNYAGLIPESSPSTTVASLARMFSKTSLGFGYENESNVYSKRFINADIHYAFLDVENQNQKVEMGFDVNGNSSWAGASPQNVWNLNFSSKGASLSEFVESSWMVNKVGLSFSKLNPAAFSWKFGVEGFHAIDRGSVITAYPTIELQNSTFSRLNVKLKVGGIVENAGLSEAFEFRYLSNSSLDLRHSRQAFAESEFTFRLSEQFVLFANVNYRQYGQFKYISGGIPNTPLYGLRYGEDVGALENKMGARITFGSSKQVVTEFHAFLNSFSYNALDLPYVELSGLSNTTTIQISNSFFAELNMDFISSRNSEFATFDLGNIILIDTNLEYFTNDRFGFFLRGINLLNQRYYWVPGYQERPIHAMAGITLQW